MNSDANINTNASQNSRISSILNLSLPISVPMHTDERSRMISLAKQENKVETEVIRIIKSSHYDHLRPNSGQGINVAGHNICVGYNEDEEYNERIWEWHGHIVLYEGELEFKPEYFYGFYNEKLSKKGCAKGKKKDGGGNNVGLRVLGADGGSSKGRVLGRNLKISTPCEPAR